MAILPPTELMLTTRPLLRIRAGSSAWVTAMWPKRLTSNRRRHLSIAKASTGTLTPMPALFTSARDARPADGVGVPVTPDTGEDVEPPPGQFARRGRADAGGRPSDDGEFLIFS